MRFHSSMMTVFTLAELEAIVAKSTRCIVDDTGSVVQILLLTDNLDADIYVSSKTGFPVLIYCFDEGPISRGRLLERFTDSGAVSNVEEWRADR